MKTSDPTQTAVDGVTIRRAIAGDLAAIYDIWYTSEIGDELDAPPRPAMFPDYPHILATGELYVAEQAGQISGFAGVVQRGAVAFLTDLFVRAGRQSAGLGAILLRRAFAPYEAGVRCTVSSTDPRALSLYIRAGLRPQWPNILLRGHPDSLAALPDVDVGAVVAEAGDPELVAWDAVASGRERPQDHAFWVREEGGVPLWLERAGQRVGYAYVRLRASTVWYPEAARIGPIGARRSEDAAACAFAAVRWAVERAPVLRLDVPGLHPCLASLLDAGMRIDYVETFVSSATAPFCDATRYIGSGGSLF